MIQEILLFFFNIWFIWLPIILGMIFWRVFRSYVVELFVEKKMNPKKYKMLEISIPKDVHKSPEAMEMVIDVLWHLGGGAMEPIASKYQGASFFPGSLEIVSIEGSVYFFIRAHEQIADLVKNTIYSQYPSAEVSEVDDYTKYVPDFIKHSDTWDIFGAEYHLFKDDFIPLKTYVDYGLDKSIGTLEEEQKIDPIAPMLEQLGTLGSGEQVWIQFIVRADHGNSWRKEAKAKIEEIMGRGGIIDDDEPFQSLKLTHGEQEMIKGIERSLDKFAFETVVRSIYIAPKEKFSKGVVGFFKNNVFKPFGSQNFNGLGRHYDTTFVDWKYQDMTGLRTPTYKRRFFKRFINRDAFYEGTFLYSLNPFWHGNSKSIILTSEELATLFHIPGRVSESSAVKRIEAVKAEPPQNLPI